MICVDCGKEKEIFREGSCLDCFLKQHRLTEAPSVLEIPYCVHCESYKYKNLWYHEPFETILTRYIKQYFSINPELTNISFSISCETGDELVKQCTIKIQGELDEHEICESHQVEIRIKNHVCDVCSKQFGGYHEAIIQIRPEKKLLSDEKLVELQIFVEDQIILYQQKKNMNLFLADIGREHGGLDFFLSDKQAAFSIVKKLQEAYGGYITVSSKNIGMKDRKQLYRDTYLLRLLPFDRADVIKFNHTYFFVEKLSKNTVFLLNLEANENTIHEASELENATIIGNKELIKYMIVVSQKNDEVQVMDQESYHIWMIKKHKQRDIKEEKISVIYIDEEHVYLYPDQNQK
jgi:nonsense-mediated mRNA decay protein 3